MQSYYYPLQRTGSTSLLASDELVKFEKELLEAQYFMHITDYFKEIYKIFSQNPKACHPVGTWNLEALGYCLTMP